MNRAYEFYAMVPNKTYPLVESLVKNCSQELLTTLIMDVMFHRPYTCARPAERLGP